MRVASSRACLPADAPKRELVERDLAESLGWQRDLEGMRPLFPTHAPVEETELAGKLVHHTGKLKAIIDVVRIACANAESEFATVVAPHMRRPREAKKLLANLFAAPGKIVVTEQAITVHLLHHLNQRSLVLPSDRLAPAANRSELDAIQPTSAFRFASKPTYDEVSFPNSGAPSSAATIHERFRISHPGVVDRSRVDLRANDGRGDGAHAAATATAEIRPGGRVIRMRATLDAVVLQR